jgi:hypothetical protein
MACSLPLSTAMACKLLQFAGARFTSALLCLVCSVLGIASAQDGTLTPGAVLAVDRAEVRLAIRRPYVACPSA